MCFGGGSQPAPPPPPPAPPPPAPAPIPAPPPPPPAPQIAPQKTDLETTRIRSGNADVEAKRRQRQGTQRLKKKAPKERQTLRTSAQQQQTPQAPGAGGVSYGGQVSGAGMSLNIQRPK